MSRDKNYQRLLNSPRWREVKNLMEKLDLKEVNNEEETETH